MNDLHLHPDYQQLRQQVESLREQMADRLAHIHELENVVKPNLFALYQSKLGPWELKLLAAQCEVARLKRKIALAQTSLNREQPIEWSRIDEQLAVEFLSYKTRIAEAASKIQTATEHFQHTLSPENSAELKKLYYALVKALHPDLHPDQADADQQLWHQVQSAYLAADHQHRCRKQPEHRQQSRIRTFDLTLILRVGHRREREDGKPRTGFMGVPFKEHVSGFCLAGKNRSSPLNRAQRA